MLQALKGMRTDEAAKLIYDTVVNKATKHEFIESAVLPRKSKRLNWKTIQQHYQIDGYKQGTEAHHSVTPEDHYHSIYFNSLDVIASSIKTRFEQPSFKAFLKLESFLLQSVNNGNISFIGEGIQRRLGHWCIDCWRCCVESYVEELWYQMFSW